MHTYIVTKKDRYIDLVWHCLGSNLRTISCPLKIWSSRPCSWGHAMLVSKLTWKPGMNAMGFLAGTRVLWAFWVTFGKFPNLILCFGVVLSSSFQPSTLVSFFALAPKDMWAVPGPKRHQIPRQHELPKLHKFCSLAPYHVGPWPMDDTRGTFWLEPRWRISVGICCVWPYA